MPERILHVALRTDFEKQPGLAKALSSIAEQYEEIDWQKDIFRFHSLYHKCRDLKPTIVFMQLQSSEVFTPGQIREAKALAPEAVWVSWDGDLRGEPTDETRRWFVEMGKVVDLSLITNTGQLKAYRDQGIRCDYLQIGIDPDIYQYRSIGPSGVPEIVFLASNYKTHQSRTDLIHKLARRYGNRFAVYGAGWEGQPFGRPMLSQVEEAPVYSFAKAAISMSIRNDLADYTSDRLFRALASGAYVLAEFYPGVEKIVPERFPFLTWSDEAQLTDLIDIVLDSESISPEQRFAVSVYARTYHSWSARMPELLRHVEAVRASR